MFFKNSIDIEGRLTRTPELKTSAKGVNYCRFSIAYNQSRKDKATGEYTNIAHYFNCVTFNKLATVVAEFKKGDPVTIGGILQYNSYEKDGVKRADVSILVNDIKLLNITKKGTSKTPNIENTSADTDNRQEEFDRNFETYDPDSYNPDENIPF